MSIINSQPLIGASGNQSTAYNLTRSLRFRSSASAYLNRTPASAGNRKTWTWSAWVKRGTLGTTQYFLDAGTAPNTFFRFTTANTLYISDYTSGPTYNFDLETTQVFRDPSAWYHLVVSVDTTQATSSNRVKIYINGSQVTAFGTATYPSQNHDTGWNASTAHRVGSALAGTNYFDGYMAEVNFVDGQALTPSDFGETDTATGVWKPKKYTGTYGTNGFYLKFDNLTSTSTLGNDSSGNSNTWTVNNISLTSGSTYDSMKDVPTLTDADTANYAVLSPISKGSSTSITNGNLTYANTGTTACNMYSTIGMTTGKFYCEVTITTNQFSLIGISDANIAETSGFYQGSRGYGYYGSNGNKYNNNTNSSYGATFTNGDVMGIAFDADAGTLTFYKNNTSQGTAYTGIPAGTYFFAQGNQTSTLGGSFNFGQQPFAYTPPSGYKALNTFNLPTPTIGATASTQANKYFDVLTWTGDNSTANATKNRTGLNFQPDLVWIKNRSNAYSHNIYDAVRGAGVTKSLQSDNTNSETTNSTNTALYGYLSAFNSDGFQTTNGTDLTSGGIWVNQSSQTYVAWSWDANGAGSSNTAGSITSTVSANTTAGFSIVTYTGNGTTGTVGHGLGVAPSLMLFKQRDTTRDWIVYHKSLGAGNRVFLNLTDASGASTANFNNTEPTSTVFSIGTTSATNGSGGTYVSYCFAEVAGYSRFGSYTGNGSTDGPFVFTGFRPKFILTKCSSAAYYWVIEDAARNSSNVVNLELFPNDSLAETNASRSVDFLSNGFKIRHTGTTQNENGQTYIYMALAENPFKYSLAR